MISGEEWRDGILDLQYIMVGVVAEDTVLRCLMCISPPPSSPAVQQQPLAQVITIIIISLNNSIIIIYYQTFHVYAK